jgi:anaerobic selenocysteine-containing dehydrogenase
MDLQLDVGGSDHPLDMTTRPSADDILQTMSEGSRIPLDVVKLHPHGATFIDPPAIVQEGDVGWPGRLQLADPHMMADLGDVLAEADDPNHGSRLYPFRMIGRRAGNAFNSSLRFPSTDRGRGYNPAFMHPEDLHDLGLSDGDDVEIASAQGSIKGVVQTDRTLRRGLVSMTHCYGDLPDRDDDYRAIGSPTGRLLANTEFADARVGMPRLGNTPVSVSRLFGIQPATQAQDHIPSE